MQLSRGQRELLWSISEVAEVRRKKFAKVTGHVMRLAALADVPPYLLRSHRQHLMFSKLHRSTVRINAELVLEIPLECQVRPRKSPCCW